jgi:hypothetical protein
MHGRASRKDDAEGFEKPPWHKVVMISYPKDRNKVRGH